MAQKASARSNGREIGGSFWTNCLEKARIPSNSRQLPLHCAATVRAVF
jgi:hypothetical protein